MTFEEKMKIVINNYFKTECSVNTSIREAFEKGFRIGASKVQKKHGKWIDDGTEFGCQCSECGKSLDDYVAPTEYASLNEIPNFCPNCGADMRDKQYD